MLLSALSAKVHVGVVPLHPPPCQPAKIMEASGVTASLIDVLEANDAEQPYCCRCGRRCLREC